MSEVWRELRKQSSPAPTQAPATNGSWTRSSFGSTASSITSGAPSTKIAIVLGVLVQVRRSVRAAKRIFKLLLKGLLYVPRVLIIDQLKSYDVAQRELLPDAEHRQSRYLDSRA
jgi:hypothetical protein